MQTLLLDPDAVERAAEMESVVAAVEDAFAADARGDTQMPAKSYIDLPQYNGDFRSMPVYLDAGDWEAAAVKWVNVHPDNPEDHDLPTVMGTVVYSDPETAFPLALLDGTTITHKRTGAAAAVATDYLAAEDARTMGIVGAGVQSYTQLKAVAAVRPVEEVVVADRDEDAVAEFVDAFSDRFDVRGGSIDEAAQCDVRVVADAADDRLLDRCHRREHVTLGGLVDRPAANVKPVGERVDELGDGVLVAVGDDDLLDRADRRDGF